MDCISANPKNEKEFATGSHDKTIIVWDAETGKPKKTLSGNAQGIWNLNYFQDGARLISASPEGICKVWDIRAGKATQVLKVTVLSEGVIDITVARHDTGAGQNRNTVGRHHRH